MKRIVCLFVILFFASATPLWGSVEKGVEAYESENYKTAFEILFPLAKQGDSRAQYYVGKMYYEGQAVPQDRTAAVGWFRKSALQGDPYGENALGVCYSYGRGVEKDVVVAAQ